MGLSIMALVFFAIVLFIVSLNKYTYVKTKERYKKEKRAILWRTPAFIALYVFLALAFSGFSAGVDVWAEGIAWIFGIGVIWSYLGYVALKRAYHKNTAKTS